MGGGKEKDQANQQVTESAAYEKKKRDEFDARNARDLGESQARNNQANTRNDTMYEDLRNRYSSLAGGSSAGGASAASSGGGGGGGGAGTPAAPGPAAYDWKLDPRFTETDKNYSEMGKTGGVDMERLRQTDDTYKSMRDTGGYSAEDRSRLGGQVGDIRNMGNRLTNFGTGGINTSIGAADQSRMRGGGGYEEMSRTGGLSQDNRDRMRGAGNWDEIARSGGLTDDDITKIQGSGTFDEFRRTGGFDPRDIQNIRDRSTSGIPSGYARMKDDANRQASITGMYGPGRAALMGRYGRDQASAESEARLNAEIGIKGQVNAGRQWGATAQSGAQQGLTSLRTANRLQATSGIAGAEAGLAGQESANKQFGISGQAASESNLQDALSRREQAGAGMSLDSLRSGADVLGQAYGADKGMLDTQNANRMNAASAQDASERQAQEMRQRGMMFGSQGLQSRAEGDRGYERGVLESDRGFDLQNRALAASSGASSANRDLQEREFEFRKQQAGLEGLSSLYGNNPGADDYMSNKQFELSNRAGSASSIGGLSNSLKNDGGGGTNWGGIASGIGSALSYIPWGGGGGGGGDNGYSSYSGDFGTRDNQFGGTMPGDPSNIGGGGSGRPPHTTSMPSIGSGYMSTTGYGSVRPSVMPSAYTAPSGYRPAVMPRR